ncbi:MAG TPA: cytochrome c3 family protein [Gemmatimonadaceae bacterium]|nr:cytochrome c3 family protein [Gemmatimonadaceae bacterium]
MIKRRHVLSSRVGSWAAIPGLAALVAGALVLSAYSGASSSQGRGPDQPIAFPHPVHVQKLGMNCLYCHNAANKSPDPGMPAVSTCMGCHSLIGPERPASDVGPKRTSAELQKLWQYADVKAPLAPFGANARPIPWERIHKVPDYVRFPHMRHVNAGVSCQSCHGDIQNMRKVSQAASLNMGWCVNCHVNGYDAAEGRRLAGLRDPQQAVAQQGAPQTGENLPPGQGSATPQSPAPGVVQAPAGDQFAGNTPASQPNTTDQRRKARYDCGVCHY